MMTCTRGHRRWIGLKLSVCECSRIRLPGPCCALTKYVRDVCPRARAIEAPTSAMNVR
jgi:hypothetical protein